MKKVSLALLLPIFLCACGEDLGTSTNITGFVRFDAITPIPNQELVICGVKEKTCLTSLCDEEETVEEVTVTTDSEGRFSTQIDFNAEVDKYTFKILSFSDFIGGTNACTFQSPSVQPGSNVDVTIDLFCAS